MIEGHDGKASGPLCLSCLPSLTDAVVAALSSAALGLAVAVMRTLSRVPASDDLLLPRRAFYPFFAFFIKAQASPAVRGALSWLALALTLASLLLVLWRLWAGFKRGRSGAMGVSRGRAPWLAAVGLLAGSLAFAALARSSIATFLDMLQNAWFLPESLDIREPPLAFVLSAVPVFLAVAAILSLAETAFSSGPWKTARPWKTACGWTTALAACWLAAMIMAQGYGAGLSLAQSSGTSVGTPGSAFILVLTEKGIPDYSVREAPLAVPGPVERAEDDLAGLERFSRLRSLQRLPALRHAYTGRAALADADGMRASALAALEAGDPLAGLLLLGSLSHAPANKDNLRMLETLADEKRWRVGPHAAFLLSAAFARFGVADRAGYWLGRASQGDAGIPAGLLVSPDSAKPSKVRGRFVFEGAAVPVSGSRQRGGSGKGEGLRVALYSRDRAIPADLSAMTLAASTVLDAKGGFEFRDMPGGDYSLALLLGTAESSTGPFRAGPARGSLRVSGHKGDIRVEGKDVSLAPIFLR
ncbi:MAG: hypothetical protein HZB91_04625 [Elusimicrobia bacterium]|nr:hypothetical protein [Elusimicrobiota bacterium]